MAQEMAQLLAAIHLPTWPGATDPGTARIMDRLQLGLVFWCAVLPIELMPEDHRQVRLNHFGLRWVKPAGLDLLALRRDLKVALQPVAEL
jgi:hypothetical protein